MPFVQHREAMIWYQVQGNGTAGTVVLVHGGLFDAMNGERFWSVPGVVDGLAAAGYRVLVPDRRYGGGKTTAPFEVLTWDTEAADIHAVITHAGADRLHLVAGSNGCSAAARFALAYPDRLLSLTLCWPAVPVNTALTHAFELSASSVATDGTNAYLDQLRAAGVPRPGEPRPGFPFGIALGRNPEMARTFQDLSRHQAAHIFRATAHALLPGDPIRGINHDDARLLGHSGIAVAIVPPEPEDPYHTYSVARSLAGAIPGARLTRGYPVPVSRFFAPEREAFTSELRSLFSDAGDERA